MDEYEECADEAEEKEPIVAAARPKSAAQVSVSVSLEVVVGALGGQGGGQCNFEAAQDPALL